MKYLGFRPVSSAGIVNLLPFLPPAPPPPPPPAPLNFPKMAAFNWLPVFD